MADDTVNMITATIDTSGMTMRLNELHDALSSVGQTGDAAMVLENEAKLFLKAVNRFTPPKNKAQGESAILGDMHKIFTPINETMLDEVGSEHGVSGIDGWIFSEKRQHNINLKWDRIDPTGEGMEAFHHKNQNRRGRTRNLNPKPQGMQKIWKAAYVISWGDFAKYVKKVQSAVGMRKAGWGVSYAKLGGAFSNWISRHLGGAKGQFQNNNLGESPSLVMANFSPGILDDQRIVNSALRARMGAIKRRCKLILSGYAADVKAGIKIAKKEKREPAESLS
jgi:hypothetical protein